MPCRSIRVTLLSVVLLATATAQEVIAQKLDYTIEVQAAHKELSTEHYWFHPYLAAIPGAGKDSLPAVVLATQLHLKSSDQYSNTYVMRTDDLGKTWSGPTPVPQLKWLTKAGKDLSIFAIVPNWHPKTGKILAIGHSVMLNHPAGLIENHRASSWAYYTVYDPKTDRWADWAPLGEPGRDYFQVRCGCDQWLIEPDGTILLPVYLRQSEGSEVWDVQVWKCAFDGKKMQVLEKGNLLARYQNRGIHEPSITKFKGKCWLTIRENETALLATSKDGLHYDPMYQWTFDDHQPLGSYNTQQHWVTHSDGLFLAYTRRGANNDDIMRSRAPIFIAQVHPERQVVLRNTERILLPNRGVPMGNFGVNNVTPYETWVSVGENMATVDGKLPTQRGAEGAILIGKIIWSKPNQSE